MNNNEINIKFDERFNFLFEKKRLDPDDDKSPLVSKYTYKWLKGGRASGKSTNAVVYAIIEAMASKQKILVLREFQSSIASSTYSLFVELIDLYHLNGMFDIYKDHIECPSTKSEILFKGVKKDPYALKSINYISKIIMEEAATFSQASLDMILPLLREQGAEAIIIWNPENEDDPVHRMSLNPPENSIVHFSTLYENPFASDLILSTAKEMARKDPDRHSWIYMGNCRKINEARVFTNWKTDILNPSEKTGWTLLYGADWSNSGSGSGDPHVLIRLWVNDDTIYIENEAYSNKCTIEELPALWDTVPDARKYVIRCDSSLPLMVSYMQRQGFKTRPAIKGPGSVETGISWMKSKNIVVHPDCINTIEELKMFSYKKNRVGDILPEFEDNFNHCIDSIRYGLNPVISGSLEAQQKRNLESQKNPYIEYDAWGRPVGVTNRPGRVI